MHTSTFAEKHKRSISLILSKNLKDAFNEVQGLVVESGNLDLLNKIENNKEIYSNLLKYFIRNVEDPQRDKFYDKVRRNLITISDQAFSEINIRRSYFLTNRFQFANSNKQRIYSEIETLLSSSLYKNNIDKLLNNAGILSDTSVPSTEKINTIFHDLFDILWISGNLSDEEKICISKIIKNDNIDWYFKSLTVSGLTLALLKHFDEAKLHLLMDFYLEKQNQVWQRALVGLLINLFFYDTRFELFSGIIERLYALLDSTNIEKEAGFVFISFLKSKDTERVTRKFHEEIIPEVLKLQPKIKEKLELDQILSNDLFEDKNPDWQEFFEESPGLMDKLQEMSEMQLSGSDVFMSTFAALKNFPFFNDTSSWFLPFYKNNTIISSSFNLEGLLPVDENFLDAYEKSTYMCNSDKYSFCLNLERMPEMQRKMVMQMFSSEISGISEVFKDDEILNRETIDKGIITQYIQDIYRFYKLFKYKSDFDDIFKSELDFYKTGFYSILVSQTELTRTTAEFYFSRFYFKQSLEVFLALEKLGETDREMIEKTAYCYQRFEDFENALEYYKRAELFGDNRAWNLKKMALCYRQLHDSSNALECYLEAEKIEPENLYIQANIGHCYLDKKDYENALNYYFKVEFLNPSNVKILRPIAWCAFILGRFDLSINYFEKLSKFESNKYDLMNMGHIELCCGNREKAIEYYNLSVRSKDNTLEMFLAGFNDDIQHLEKHGVNKEHIPLILDQVRFSL